ncbi:MAG: hypothetical protein IJR42_01330 [Paludibacteraceae bacterium]|nr:hypothetical protein [Paludibacteraceae bacterium]
MELTHRLNVQYETSEITTPEEYFVVPICSYATPGGGTEYIAEGGLPTSIFPETGESLHGSGGITIPSGKTARIVIPVSGVVVMTTYPQLESFTVETTSGTKTVSGVPNATLALLNDAPSRTVEVSGGNTIWIICKAAGVIENLSVEIISPHEYAVINEPVGFDDLQMTMKRNDYHGMGAEVSLGTLEFYGLAYDLIKSSYDDDIDNEVIYSVLDASNNTLFRGVLDLSTCSFSRADYQSVKVKVGEVGPKTIFNNRTDKEIDMDDPKTIDGSAVTSPTWKSLHIPMKHLLYTILSKRDVDSEEIYQSAGDGQTSGSNYIYFYTWKNTFSGNPAPNALFLPLGENPSVEFGTFAEQTPPYTTSGVINSAVDDIRVVNPQYYANADHETKYGSNTEANVRAHLELEIRHWRCFYQLVAGGGYDRQSAKYSYYVRLVGYYEKDGNHFINGNQVYISAGDGEPARQTITLDLENQIPADVSLRYYLEFTPGYVYRGTSGDYQDVLPQQIEAWIKIKAGSYFKMTMYDNLPETNVNADMLLVHDALNVVSHAISENVLPVKSDWYRTPDSQWESGTLGGGALKAITNGYKIRGLFTDGVLKRNMPMSFKALIESLSALDNIGWGFSTESGTTCVRVERWDWFYKDTVVLTLDHVAEITKDVYIDRIPTELKIGYKKYATQEQYNSIESPHGTRNYINGIKAVSKEITKECEFIADNYAIEETRRARTQKNATEETTYDESIFIFELIRKGPSSGTRVYSIGHTAVDAENVGRAEEFINAKLTPYNMAKRWRDYLFAANNTTPLKFTTGEINYKAAFGVIPETDTVSGVVTDSLLPFGGTSKQAENLDVEYQQAKFKAEKLTFSYPLTIAQYNAIKANPYGLVQLTEGNTTIAQGWILDFKYKFEDGMADFTLIAKR